MLWVVAALVFLVVTTTVRRYLRQDRLVPSGFMNALEIVVEFVRDGIVEPNVGRKWVKTWTPLLLTLGIFILAANAIGLIPIFDVLSLINHTVLHLPEESFMAQVLHGGTTATGNSTSRRRWRRSRSSPSSSPARARTASCSTGRTWCRTACRCR